MCRNGFRFVDGRMLRKVYDRGEYRRDALSVFMSIFIRLLRPAYRVRAVRLRRRFRGQPELRRSRSFIESRRFKRRPGMLRRARCG